MPGPTRVQVVLVEVAAAAVVGGYAINAICYYVGIGVAVVLLPLALVPRDKRWLYQVAVSRLGLLRRSRSARRSQHTGLAALFGDYRIESIDSGEQSSGSDVAVVRAGTTWTLPLVLGLDDVTNADAPVPLDLLAGLLEIEGVPLSSVRLFTLATPANATEGMAAGPSAPLPRLAARYCLLTLDTRRAVHGIAERGGTEAAVRQIMRRCAIHTEQVMATADVPVRRLDGDAVFALFGTWMGPASSRGGHRAADTVETRHEVRVGGVWSTVFAVTGTGPDVLDRVARLASAAPTPVVGTCLVLRPAGRPSERSGARTAVSATMLVRMSSPDDTPRRDAYNSLSVLAGAYDLDMQRVDGEQAELFRATTLLGVGEQS